MTQISEINTVIQLHYIKLEMDIYQINNGNITNI